jgi:outer membrane protein assembly factor BamE (lipoprotein component of BamABCDE complex)
MITKKFNWFIGFVLLVGCLTGCATRIISSDKLDELRRGMTKEEVIQLLGKPSDEKGTVTSSTHGYLMEVWEYNVSRSKKDENKTKQQAERVMSTIGGANGYWLYFLDDNLVQWKEAGDWGRESNQKPTSRHYPLN